MCSSHSGVGLNVDVGAAVTVGAGETLGAGEKVGKLVPKASKLKE